MGVYKCNTDASYQLESGVGCIAFCIRDIRGDLKYAESRRINTTSILEAEVMAIKERLQYCNQGNFLPLIIETDSLVAQKVIHGVWEVPWQIAWDIRHIQTMIKSHGVEVVHVLREGNSLADALTKSFAHFAGIERQQYQNMQELPQHAKAILQQDKEKTPNLRIRKVQNKHYNGA